MTNQEAHERILELDDLIFEADTGQREVTWEEYSGWKIEVETLMDALARSLSTHGNQTYDEAYKARESVRSINLVAAIMQRHCALHPDTAQKEDPLLIKAFHSGTNGDEIDNEALEQFMLQFSYLFDRRPQPPAQPMQRIISLGARIEELFVQQGDRIGFHNNEEENGYRREEGRLSSMMLDKTLPDQKHLEHAQAILAWTQQYTSGFVQSLHSLNADIDRHLAAAEQEVDSILGRVQQPTQELSAPLENLRRWLALSKDLQNARLVAARTIVMRVDCDRVLPNIIIANQGRSDVMLKAEETAEFQQSLADVSVMYRQSFDDNERIQKERLPLAQMLFTPEASSIETGLSAETTPVHAVPAVRVHPLQSKAWFRLAKVFYIFLWVITAAFFVMLVFTGGVGNLALGAAFISVVLLVALRKGFYYVTLGRTTVAEPPGSGFLDWDELYNDFDSIKANNPEFYKTVVGPFLSSWKQQYGRRVPIQAYEVFRKRVDTELEELRTEKQRIIDDAAKKGRVIEISALRINMEKTKAEYKGSDRAAYVRGIDDWIIKLEAQYGTSIPVDEASRILDEMDVKIRNDKQ